MYECLYVYIRMYTCMYLIKPKIMWKVIFQNHYSSVLYVDTSLWSV